MYAFEGESTKFCKKHKLDGMIDVHSPRCIFPECQKYPSVGKLHSKGSLYCSSHGGSNRYCHGRRNPMCIITGCKEFAIFIEENDDTIYPIRCFLHKLPSDIELIDRHCSVCNDKVYFPFNREICMQCGGYRSKLRKS